MAGSIKGIIVEIGGDTSRLQKALSKVNSATSSLSRELRGINSLLKLDPKNTELLNQKQSVLNESISITKKSLEQLQQIKEESDKKMADGTKISEDNYRALQRQIINTQNKLSDLKNEASNWHKAGSFLTNLGNELDTVSNKINSLGNKLTTRLTVPVVAGFGVMTKSAIENETAVQQVEKIYGKAADSIKDFAENKAIDYNMSANEAYKYSQIYGNLIQSITDDQTQNAEKTQQLLQASSIIASSTGRSMEDVMDRIRSGLLGNTEAIEDLGVNVNVALLETTDAFKQIAGDKSWKKLTFQEQQQVRLLGILEQTSKKYGKEVNQNTATSIQQLTAKTKNLTNSLGKKLLPVGNKLLDKANDLMDRFDNLSDAEQENIIKIGLMVAAAGPLLKIGSSAISVTGSVAKGLGTFTEAIGLAKNGIGTATGSAANLAKMFQTLTNPLGLAVIGITAVAAALAYFVLKETDAQKSAKKLAKEMSNQKESFDEYNAKIDESTNANIAQINSVEKLKNELKTLVNADGKVKKGYEARVSFILNELNKALGTEYKLNGRTIQGYKNLQKEIDKTIKKKKAEIYLSASEEKYKEAIKNEEEYVENLKTSYEKLQDTQEKYYGMDLEALKKYTEGLKELRENYKIGFYLAGYNKELEEIQAVIKAYEDAEYTLKETTENKEEYEKNYELFVQEKYNKIGNTVKNTTKNWTDSSLQIIKDSIEAESENLKTYSELYRKTGSEVALQQKQQAEENIKNLANELIKRTSTIHELSQDEINAWKTLANKSYSEYSQAISKMPSKMKEKIEEATGIVAKDVNLKNAMKELGKKAKEGFKANTDGKKWGKDLTKELSDGLTSSSSETYVSKAAKKVSKWISDYLHFSLPEKGPLSDMDESMPDMIDLMVKGIDKNKSKLVHSSETLAKILNSKLVKEPILSMKDFEKLQCRVNSQVIDSTKTVFTTPQIVFNVQELDEAKLNQCFNYVNRKFGSQY